MTPAAAPVQAQQAVLDRPAVGTPPAATVRGSRSGRAAASAATTPGPDARAPAAPDASIDRATASAAATTPTAPPAGLPADASPGAVPAPASPGTPAGTAPAGDAAAPAPSTGAPGDAADQVLRHLTSVRALRDGGHRTVLRLDPEHLGEVTVTVDVRGGDVRMAVTGGEQALAALREGLGQLRSSLSRAGLELGDVALRPDSPVSAASATPVAGGGDATATGTGTGGTSPGPDGGSPSAAANRPDRGPGPTAGRPETTSGRRRSNRSRPPPGGAPPPTRRPRHRPGASTSGSDPSPLPEGEP